MKPLIGIIASMEIDQKNYHVSQFNVDAIIKVGGIPVILPFMTLKEDIAYYAKIVDGLYAIGGDDINPLLFGEEPKLHLGPVLPMRDTFELALILKVVEKGKPYFGVCRGAQILNVAHGGTMFQDINSQIETELIQHCQTAPEDQGSHYVNVTKDSLLHRITGRETLLVNSWHHQANKQVALNMNVSAQASDNLIEAIEHTEHDFVLGVQWHPEILASKNDEASLKLFKGFVNACKRNK